MRRFNIWKFIWWSYPGYQSQGGNQDSMDHDSDSHWTDRYCNYDRYVPHHDRVKNNDDNNVDPDKFKTEDVLSRILMKVEGMDKMVHEIKSNFSQLTQIMVSYFASIKQLVSQLKQISI